MDSKEQKNLPVNKESKQDIKLLDGLSTDFHNLLKHCDSKLVDFLKNYGNYTNLSKLITIFEKNGPINILGKLLNVQDRKMTISELPTRELLNIIRGIMVSYDLKYAHEIYARSGILSKCLKEHCMDMDIEVFAYDCYPTPTDTKFIKISNIDKIYETKNISYSLIIVNWPHNKSNIHHILKKLNPKFILFIGDIGGMTKIENAHTWLHNKGYENTILYGKQISWTDYFYYNQEKSCHSNSALSLYTLTRTKINKSNLIEIIGPENCIVKKEKSMIDLLYDLAIQEKIPLWICRNVPAIELYSKYIHDGLKKLSIPIWITNIDTLKFWLYCNMNYRLRQSIDEKTFYHGLALINNLKQNGLHWALANSIVSDKIKNMEDAENEIIYNCFIRE